MVKRSYLVGEASLGTADDAAPFGRWAGNLQQDLFLRPISNPHCILLGGLAEKQIYLGVGEKHTNTAFEYV